MTGDGAASALVISLDFELYWGVRDFFPGDGGSYRPNLLAMREVIPRTLRLFSTFDIAATWATVGLLYSPNAGDAQARIPTSLPAYLDPKLTPYEELRHMAADDGDPIRFAPDLIRLIAESPRQEIGTHTYSHYYCLEPGQSQEAFRADLVRAIKAAEAAGVERPRSIVFPRNQFNPEYAGVMAELGFQCCRTNARGWFNREVAGERYFRPEIRISRLVDSFAPLTGSQVIQWRDLEVASGVCCLPASHFVRSHAPRLRRLDGLKARRLRKDLERAARDGGIVHLWWHPENFGLHADESFAFLTQILESFAELRERYGIQSLTMSGIGDRLKQHASLGDLMPTYGLRPVSTPIAAASLRAVPALQRAGPLASDRGG